MFVMLLHCFKMLMLYLWLRQEWWKYSSFATTVATVAAYLVLVDDVELTDPVHGCDSEVIAGRALVTVQTCTGADLPTFFFDGEVRMGQATRSRSQRIGHGAKRATIGIPRFHLWSGKQRLNKLPPKSKQNQMHVLKWLKDHTYRTAGQGRRHFWSRTTQPFPLLTLHN